MELMLKTYRGFSEEYLDLVCAFENKIFEDPYPREKYDRESRAKHQLISLFAFSGSELCGFKVGYEMTARLYYSWVGGVLPEYRRQGIATKLMQEQHKVISSLGYKVVRTYTENKYRPMLLLNIKAGFDVVGVVGEQGIKTNIVLDKKLVS